MVLSSVLLSGMSLKCSALALYLQTDAINTGNAKTLTVFVGITAVCFVIIAISALVTAVLLLKAKNQVMAEIQEIKGKVMPLVVKSHALVNDLTPEIKLITTKVHEITVKVNDITAVVKEKAEEISPTISKINVTVQDAVAKSKSTFDDANQTVGDVNKKTRVQVERFNGMVSDALDATTRIARAIEHGITQPARELSGIFAGAKATTDSLLHHTDGLRQELVGKLSELFSKKKPAAGGRTPASYPSSAPRVTSYGSMANAAGSGTTATVEPGVSSGSTGNGDPIVG